MILLGRQLGTLGLYNKCLRKDQIWPVQSFARKVDKLKEKRVEVSKEDKKKILQNNNLQWPGVNLRQQLTDSNAWLLPQIYSK